MNFVSNA